MKSKLPILGKPWSSKLQPSGYHLDIALTQCIINHIFVFLHLYSVIVLGVLHPLVHKPTIDIPTIRTTTITTLHTHSTHDPHPPTHPHTMIEHVLYTTYPPWAAFPSTKSMAANNSCFCKWAHFHISSLLFPALTEGSLEATPVPLQGASRSTRSHELMPRTLGSWRPS